MCLPGLLSSMDSTSVSAYFLQCTSMMSAFWADLRTPLASLEGHLGKIARAYLLYVKLSKCKCLHQAVQFLRHFIGVEGKQADCARADSLQTLKLACSLYSAQGPHTSGYVWLFTTLLHQSFCTHCRTVNCFDFRKGALVLGPRSRKWLDWFENCAVQESFLLHPVQDRYSVC